jgi:hypothetical protein
MPLTETTNIRELLGRTSAWAAEWHRRRTERPDVYVHQLLIERAVVAAENVITRRTAAERKTLDAITDQTAFLTELARLAALPPPP